MDPRVHKGILSAAVKSLGFTVVAIVVGFGIGFGFFVAIWLTSGVQPTDLSYSLYVHSIFGIICGTAVGILGGGYRFLRYRLSPNPYEPPQRSSNRTSQNRTSLLKLAVKTLIVILFIVAVIVFMIPSTWPFVLAPFLP